MSKYTTQIRFICEQLSCIDSSFDTSNIDVIIESAYYKIFDFDFPIFDERYRKILCAKILKRYYFREIGFETYALWKVHLNTTLNEIMPYYNKLYESELLKFNPLYDVDTKIKHNIKNDGTFKGTSKTDSNSNSIEKYSDTPQGSVNGIYDDKYLTSATLTDNDGNNNTEENNDTRTTEDYIEFVNGKQGTQSYSKLLNEYRTTFLNIDKDIIDELYDLFMLIW